MLSLLRLAALQAPLAGGHTPQAAPKPRYIWPVLALERDALAGNRSILSDGFSFDANRTGELGQNATRRQLQTCPPGTEDLMGTGESCISCAPGRFDDDMNPNTFCNACAGGQVAEGGTTFCTTCPTGTFAMPGTYNTQSSSSTAGRLERDTGCFQCPNGKYSRDVQATCDICESGYVDHDEDPSTPCVICHPGSYTPPGSTVCFDCTPGRYDDDRRTSTPCVACDVGTFANFTVFGTRRWNLLQADNSPWIGTLEPPHCRSTDEPDCYQASEDMNLLKLTSCEECVPGQFDHDSDPATPCIFCDPGKVSWTGTPVDDEEYYLATDQEVWIGRGSWKAVHCEACTAGMYAKYEQPSCLDCVGGSYTPDDGMFQCDICERGTMSLDKASSCIICDRGTFAAQPNSSTCEMCAVGQYGNQSKASSCVFCPDVLRCAGMDPQCLELPSLPGCNAEPRPLEVCLSDDVLSTLTGTKEGGTMMRTCCKPGNWANDWFFDGISEDAQHDTCYGCATPAMCAGNGDCDTGREGNWCASCIEGWFAMNQKCNECPENSAPMVIGAVLAFVALSMMVVNIATTKQGGGKAASGSIVKEVGATPMSILFTRLQISLPVFKLSIGWPDWLKGWFDFLKGMISLDVSALTAPECFTTGDPAAMYLSRSVSKLFLFPLLCVQMTIVFQCFQRFVWRPRGFEVRNTNVFNSWVAAYSFLFVMLATSGFEPFSCTTVRGVPLLDAQRELLCYEGEWIVIASIGIAMLLVYAVLVPTFLFRALLKMRVSHFGDNILRTEKNKELKARFGWIYERYRPAAWYYEFIMIFQRIMSIGISNIFGDEESATQGFLCYFILTVFVLRIQSRTKPYPEIVVDTETLFNNPKIPKRVRRILKTTPQYLSWNNMEQMGIYAQLTSLVVGLYFMTVGDGGPIAIALVLGLVTMCGYALFIVSNLIAIALRVWALTREGNKYYEAGTRTPLHDYAEENLLSKVFDEMSKGVDINGLDEENETPLYCAVKAGHLRIITALINGGADPNLGCGAGRWCTLHAATNVETVKLLFIGGADATLQDSWGKTAEDVQLEESEVPPVPKRGERQTAADREKYRRERLRMADMIADKQAERVCDWAWKMFCPHRRTRKITPYGKIKLDKPKRPGMAKLGGSKEDIMRHFFRKYGSEQQVRQVDNVLKQVLVGEDDIQNYDLFCLYCKKLEQLHGANPRDVWRQRTDEEKEAQQIRLDGYGGSGQAGKPAAAAFTKDDYKVHRGMDDESEDKVFSGKLPWHEEAQDEEDEDYYSYSDDSDADDSQLPGAVPTGNDANVSAAIARMKIKARERAKANKEAARVKGAKKRLKKSGLHSNNVGASTSIQETRLKMSGSVEENDARRLRAELQGMTLGELKERAEEAGVGEQELSAAIDSADDPKFAAITVIEDALKAERGAGSGQSALDSGSSLLERIAASQEDWISAALKRNSSSTKSKGSRKVRSVKVLDRQSFRENRARSLKVAPTGGGGSAVSGNSSAGGSVGSRSVRNHNRAMSFMDADSLRALGHNQ